MDERSGFFSILFTLFSLLYACHMRLSRPTKSQAITTVGILCILIIIVYGHIVEYPFVRWDDGMLIYDNPVIRSINLRTLKTIFTTYDPELYVPLTLMSYQLDFLIGGIHPAIYHLQSILWHLLNAVLLTWLLAWLSSMRNTTEHSPVTGYGIALGLGCLFAVHPINVETVVWASARKDLLSTAFAFATMLSYLLWITDTRRRWYYLSLVLFTAGLLSKVTVISVPLMLIIIDLWCRRHGSRTMLLEKIPFLLLSLAFAIIAVFGKSAQLLAFTPWETCLVIVKAIMFSAGTWVLPFHLSVLYPFHDSVSIASPEFFLPILCLFGILGILGLLSHRYRSPTPLFCVSLFLIPLLPSLLNFSKGGFIYITSDRYAYLPSLGILLGLMLVLERLFHRMPRRTVAGIILVLCIATALARMQTTVWAGSEPLFRNVLRRYPDSHIAHNNLANFLSEKARAEGNIDAAIEEYKRALETNNVMQRSFERDNAQSKILSNMASAYRQSGDISSAMKYYEEALRMNAINPYAMVGLGIIAGIEGNRTESERMYMSAITAAPRFSPAYLNLGSLYASIGRYPEALTAFETAIDIDPFLPQAHFNRGVMLQKLGRLSEALGAYRAAVNIAPVFVAARINLGILEANRGKRDKAAEQFEEVLRIDPTNTKAIEALKSLRGT